MQAQAQTSIPGVINLDLRAQRAQKIGVLIVTILPFLGLVAAIVSLWGTGFSVLDGAILAVTYTVTCLGVTVGFHRFLTHGSFKTNSATKAALSIAGSMAIEGSVNSWVAAHRRHHAFSDRNGDPHSPHLDEGEGFMGIVRGLWHAHMGWLFSSEQTEIERWAPDLMKDPVIRRVNKLFPLWVVISLTAPAVAGLLITRSWQGAVTAFLWGSLVRVLLLHHVTWSINSICHFYGKRPYETKDHSTNNWPLAILSFGESWHNNHHAFPTSARHGLQRGQVDISAGLIRLLQRFGLATDVKTVTDKQAAAKGVAAP
ncbi:MAG: acyl-CoA desaturase [Actinobacteria bacterium]|nr:acyl-CoA desaturase [Actinomycetota bacterium]